MPEEYAHTTGFVESVLQTTWADVEAAIFQIPLPLWNESTFRWFFVRAALSTFPEVKCQLEWNKIDLLVQLENENHLIEFKFYGRNRHQRLDGSTGGWKGGPGRKNYTEFWDCVRKLHKFESERWRQRHGEREQISGRHLILAYAESETPIYRDWYQPLRPAPPTHCDINAVLRAKDLHLHAVECRGSKRHLRCQLFEVQ
ncbi:MAG: hypothetical protein KF861_06495 [Planctomycetaceae bacterium]|nr:hypothetical protein [Planctomycetaceae bacterium]